MLLLHESWQELLHYSRLPGENDHSPRVRGREEAEQSLINAELATIVDIWINDSHQVQDIILLESRDVAVVDEGGLDRVDPEHLDARQVVAVVWVVVQEVAQQLEYWEDTQIRDNQGKCIDRLVHLRIAEGRASVDLPGNFIAVLQIPQDLPHPILLHC